MKRGRLSWRKFRLVALASAMSILPLAGCSIYMASTQPPKKNLDVLKEGTPRSIVLAELGQPISSDVKDGKRTDAFYFTQGYSQGNKASRAVFHTAADVLTIGLWEVVATPGEAIFSGKKVGFEVIYTEDEKVEKVVSLEPSQAATP